MAKNISKDNKIRKAKPLTFLNNKSKIELPVITNKNWSGSIKTRENPRYLINFMGLKPKK